ncbi:MAG TPA: pyridoxamine 5'-phosphate oxidase family protein [Pseudonocardiaceae bacterium]|jgi:general stress protein 26|nr:pyridoxamine 5'-phosphate oxidase family protein [Pseudonocardiaceae bacterium]
MFETEAELDELQALLDASLARSTEHLRSIVKPGERTLTARQLMRLINGMCTLSIATVTAGGEPRISAIDGHFLHGRWFFGTSTTSAKARHLAARPAVSVSYLVGEELGVFTHGHAELLNPADGPEDPQWPSVLAHLTEHYGQSPSEWGDVAYYRLRPSWMVVFAGDPAKLLNGSTNQPSQP